ncbi:hypothetical protein [Paenarthrobacter ilicis]|uniref:hypothetical protein n=1 Tax=Paenarthrobacter ilicis TaxID=43665 RepID=UPI00300BDA5C
MNRPDSNSADQSANNDDDAVWLDLVARLESTQTTTEGPGPGGSAPAKSFRDFDPLGLSTPAVEESPDPSMGPGRSLTPAGSADGERPLGPRDYEAPEDDESFVPEEPPSLAGTEPMIMLAWVGAVGGPIALLFTAMFWRSAPLLAVLGIVAAFVVAVVYLIMRLPQEKNEDDDGARI